MIRLRPVLREPTSDELERVGLDPATIRAFEAWRLIAMMEESTVLRGVFDTPDGLSVREFVRSVAERHPDFAGFEARHPVVAGATVH